MRLIIFDFDGVIADSEAPANEILAESLTAIGAPTTTEDAIRLYMGRRWLDCAPIMEECLGSVLPEGFLETHIATVHARLKAEVTPVPGVLDFLHRHADIPRCIGSSSKLDYIGQSLDRMAMSHWFEHRFSGHDVPRGKPHPDLFLKAAATLNTSTADCLVIEDSPPGVMAGKAAGMKTIGPCAGSHILDGHWRRLEDAGADHVVASYAEIDPLIMALTT
ncbi:HAD family hydrolase [Caulobacter sp. DWR1-3-2b1]|uniref:HAD family hydrolase n=1 Tax=Caulobacter sp. DWR1-3-2b1 TaxID=2804670 RepID=UPI003CEB8229